MFVQKVLYEAIIMTMVQKCLMCGWLHKKKLALAELISVEAIVRRQYTLCFFRTVFGSATWLEVRGGMGNLG